MFYCGPAIIEMISWIYWQHFQILSHPDHPCIQLPDFAVMTTVCHVISHPVVYKPLPWFIRDNPREHPPTLIPNKQSPVVFCNSQGGHRCRFCVVRSFKSCVHGQLGPEHKLHKRKYYCVISIF